jgi:hypothetical protein
MTRPSNGGGGPAWGIMARDQAMTIRLTGSASALLLACALALGPDPASAAGRVPGEHAASSRSAAAAAPASPATDAVPPSPADLAGMLPAVCGREHVARPAGGGGARPECRSVPAYPTHCAGPLRIGAVIHGSFTSPSAVEVLADYEGCEPHAANFGGSVLLRRRGAGWERLAFLPGDRSATCLRLPRPNGTDALACYSSWSGQGEKDGAIDLLRFDAAGKLISNAVRRFSDITWDPQLCNRREVGREQVFESFGAWSRTPASGGQPLRLVVRVKVESFAVPQFCAAADDDADAAADDNAIFARFAAWRRSHERSTELTFTWNGSSLSPVAPAAQAP